MISLKTPGALTCYDPDLGLYYNRARYLNADTGRFWSRDVHEGVKIDPYTLHKYLYVRADPINSIDPSGWFSLSEIMESIGIDGEMRKTMNLLVSQVRQRVTRKLGCDVAKAVAVQGVYVLELASGELYVGQSNDIARRFGEHLRDLEKAGARIVGMLEITSGIEKAKAAKYLREIFEALLIEKLAPKGNTIRNPVANRDRLNKYIDPVQVGMDKLFELTPFCK